MGSAYLDEGQRHLEAGDWVEAIQSLAWARDAEPANPEPYLALIEAYERAAEAEREPDLLQQAFNVCRDLRDRRLAMSAERQGQFFQAFLRVRDKVVAAKRSGWSPPPPKEQVHTLFRKPDGT
jgi:hypothetical protein